MDLSALTIKVKSEQARLARFEGRYEGTRRALREVKQENRVLSAEAASARRAVGGMKLRLEEASRELERAQWRDRPALHIDDWSVVQWLLRNVEIAPDVFGPWSGDVLRRELGFKVGTCGAKGAAPVLIVGRSGWSKRAIEQHVSNREGEALYIFPQELFIASLLAGRNPFDEREDEDTMSFLKAFGKGHPLIEWLQSLQFPWPEIGFEGPPSGSDFEQVDESPLFKLGYRVGTHKGRTASERHELLSKAFQNPLPLDDSMEYMQAWAEPGTRLRLQRIAWHIAMLVRAHSKIRSNVVAVEQWKSDLDWLYRNYFSHLMRFLWP